MLFFFKDHLTSYLFNIFRVALFLLLTDLLFKKTRCLGGSLKFIQLCVIYTSVRSLWDKTVGQGQGIQHKIWPGIEDFRSWGLKGGEITATSCRTKQSACFQKFLLSLGKWLLRWAQSMDGEIDIYKHFTWLKRVSDLLALFSLSKCAFSKILERILCFAKETHSVPQTLNGVSFFTRSELKTCLGVGGGGLRRGGRKSAVFVFKNETLGSNFEQMAIDLASACAFRGLQCNKTNSAW